MEKAAVKTGRNVGRVAPRRSYRGPDIVLAFHRLATLNIQTTTKQARFARLRTSTTL